jgi:predicted enzyme related to lactoylglutathione lyase
VSPDPADPAATRLASVVIDCIDPATVGRWWSAALGWPITYEAPDEVVVEPEDTDGWSFPALVFGTVPEPKVVKNPIHLDLASQSADHHRETVERLVALGATHVDIGQRDVPWIVLADPEGNELCVLEPRERYLGAGPLAAVVIDCVDPRALAPFWAAATGWTIAGQDDDLVSLHAPHGRPPDVELLRVPGERAGKIRLHLDVAPFADGDTQAAVDRLLALGARPLDVGQRDVSWIVLADPEGNALCVLSPR